MPRRNKSHRLAERPALVLREKLAERDRRRARIARKYADRPTVRPSN